MVRGCFSFATPYTCGHMARNRPSWQYWAEYLGVRTVAGALQTFDENQNLRLARSLGSLFHQSNRKRRERAETNIRLSFPDWSEQHIAATARASMQHMFELFLVDSLVMTRKITPGSWPRYTAVHPDTEPFIGRLLNDEPMLMITGHCGNWELLGHFIAMMGHSITALARPLDNPLLNKWLLDIREQRGMRILTKYGSTPVLREIARKGGRLGFIADQNAGDRGMFVPFFGRLASSYKSIGLLAMRYKLPIVAGIGARIDHKFRYNLHMLDMIDPHEWQGHDDPLYYITARYNYALEKMITLYPSQYLWLHRRWKSRPRHERLGKPMPRRMIDKLYSLPWLSDAEIERIVDHSNRSAAIAASA